jgi:hypothetical protein
MRIEQPRDDASDGLDDAIRELISARSNGAPDAGLQGRIVGQVADARQRRRSIFIPARWCGAWPSQVGFGRGRTLGSIAVVAAVAIVLIGVGLLGGVQPTTSPGGIGSSSSASPVATDGYPSAAPHVSGTCPVTPITRVVGGEAPEVDVSGLRWRWAYAPWVAGVDEKVVWLDDAGLMPLPGVSVFATQLDEPILVAGHPTTFAKPTASVYAAATDVQWVTLIRLPNPGCWLLTAVWSAGASSVVVAAAPSPGSPATSPSSPGPIVKSGPLAVCPASPPTGSTTSGGSGPAFEDGAFQWLVPPSQTWRIGGDGDKLVLYGPWGADERVVAIPLARATGVGWLAETVVTGDIPPGFGGGTMGFGMTLPARDCWAFVYLDAAATSTIVDDLRQPSGATTSLSPEFGRATWALDPAFPAPKPGSTELHILVWEQACSSGTPPTGRMSAPVIRYADTTVTITIGVRPLSGAQDCQGITRGTPDLVQLAEPLGTRTLLDGGHVPPAPPTPMF